MEARCAPHSRQVSFTLGNGYFLVMVHVHTGRELLLFCLESLMSIEESVSCLRMH